jgi:hypothetical protein
METRTETIRVRVTPTEKTELVAEAEAQGVKLSEYLRIVGLNRSRVPNQATVTEAVATPEPFIPASVRRRMRMENQ